MSDKERSFFDLSVVGAIALDEDVHGDFPPELQISNDDECVWYIRKQWIDDRSLEFEPVVSSDERVSINLNSGESFGINGPVTDVKLEKITDDLLPKLSFWNRLQKRIFP